MSLDVELKRTYVLRTCPCPCQHTYKDPCEATTLFSANITHNLGRLAEEAGVYLAVWRPEEAGINQAGQLIEPLSKAIELLKREPDRFRQFNAANGWGTYDQFLPWLQSYLDACLQHPTATVSAWR